MTSSLPIRPGSRVILDNDWTGDPDGLVALAHHLLSPSNDIVLVTSSRLAEPLHYDGGSAVDGARFAREVIDLSGVETAPEVVAGSQSWFADGARSDAADAIADFASSDPDDDLPLYLVCAGPLTNVAQAIAQTPGIVQRLTLVWVGGSTVGAAEYNHDTDRPAAQFVLGQLGLPIIQFPLEAYRQVACSVTELQTTLALDGDLLGRRLWQAFLDLPIPAFIRLSGTWALGDSCPLLVTALTNESSVFSTTPGSDGAASRTTYSQVDARLLVADLVAKLRLSAG